MKSILRKALDLANTVINSARIKDDSIVFEARPYKTSQRRCPVCFRKCKVYDSLLVHRRWRALDLGSTRIFLEYMPVRIKCPDHGVHVENIPWARHNSWFTHAFEEQVAWLCVHCNRSVVAEMMRIDWKTVGPVCKRVFDDLEKATGISRYDGLVRIGIDETSYRKGHKYMTVVVDHDRNRVVWCGKGHGKEVLGSFFDLLSAEQRKSIKVVTADGARWIASVVKDRCQNAERVMDPFHVVSWMTDILDELRKQSWRDAHKQAKLAPKRSRGRPKKNEEANPEKAVANAIKQARYPLLKNPDDLSETQKVKLESIARSDTRLYRAYLLKEDLRAVFSVKGLRSATELLDGWLSHACRCRIPEVVGLSKKVRRHRQAILKAVEHGISNARIEATNTKIKLTVRMGYGFRNIDNLIALVMLRCSDLPINLPGRAQKAA